MCALATCMHTHTHTLMSTFMHIHTDMYAHTHSHLQTHAHTHTHIPACTHILTLKHVCTHSNAPHYPNQIFMVEVWSSLAVNNECLLCAISGTELQSLQQREADWRWDFAPRLHPLPSPDARGCQLVSCDWRRSHCPGWLLPQVRCWCAVCLTGWSWHHPVFLWNQVITDRLYTVITRGILVNAL